MYASINLSKVSLGLTNAHQVSTYPHFHKTHSPPMTQSTPWAITWALSHVEPMRLRRQQAEYQLQVLQGPVGNAWPAMADHTSEGGVRKVAFHQLHL
eukprot:1672613-Amphidinium_carterae.1